MLAMHALPVQADSERVHIQGVPYTRGLGRKFLDCAVGSRHAFKETREDGPEHVWDASDISGHRALRPLP
jgi:hypothetical protein